MRFFCRGGRNNPGRGRAGLAWVLAAGLLADGVAQGALFYVAPGGSDANAGTNWVTAKQTIQAAVDLAVSNDVVLVSNGVYATGGRLITGMVSNRVAITNAVTVQSVNGPAVTTIVGVGPVGAAAMRCVYVGTNARLAGFTLTNGATLAAGATLESSGGGAACAASAVVSNCVVAGCVAASLSGGVHAGRIVDSVLAGNAAAQGGASFGSTMFGCLVSNNTAHAAGGGLNSVIAADSVITGNRAGSNGGGLSSGQASNCVVSFNRAAGSGGGLYNSTQVRNCAVFGNTAGLQGGGVYAGQVRNCTVIGNAANEGGGARGSVIQNSIVYDNAANFGGNTLAGSLSNCCTVPLAPGAGNFTNAPQLAGARDLSAGSPCFRAGSSLYAFGADFDGESWAGPPSLGCDEVYPGAVTGGLRALPWVAYTNVAAGFGVAFIADATGRVTQSVWNFGDGTVLTNRAALTRAFAAPGVYPVTLTVFNESFPGGVAATVTVQVAAQTVHYVRPANAGAAAPFTSWATASSNIQGAVDAATQAGALVLVTNGAYGTGGRVVAGALTNRVVLDKPIELRGLNGPAFTTIIGAGPTGAAAVRCVWVGSGATLSGFTLTGGATASTGDATTVCSGGGAFGQLPFAVLTNCVFAGNAAAQRGGGLMYGLVFNSVFSNNTSVFFGGGASDAYAWDDRFVSNTSDRGGAVHGGRVNRSVLEGNRALTFGGGVYLGALNQCVVRNNSADLRGGGADNSLLTGCALYRNFGAEGGGGANSCGLQNCTVVANRTLGDGGGVRSGGLTNTIVYHNTGSAGPNWALLDDARGSCSFPLLPGAGNLAADPVLAGAYHLSGLSPCRSAGATNSASGFDVDGDAWAAPPSIGCDELTAGTATGALGVAILISSTNLGAGGQVNVEADIAGRVTNSVWNYGDGTVVSNRPLDNHVFGAVGIFPVVLTAYNDAFPAGVSATVVVQVAAPVIHYVNSSNATPAAPFTSWATAATNIQNAIDAATQVGAVVLVTNGNYNTGSATARGTMPNRVVVRQPLVVRSVNGPAVTLITGGGGLRCVYLGTNAQLSGFTLAGGNTSSSGGYYDEGHGGGAWLEPTALVTNCIVRSCSGSNGGGGVYGGTVRNSTIANNSAQYAEGGGGYGVTFIGCTIVSNSTANLSSSGTGGGVSACVVYDSTLAWNRAGTSALQWGGGAAHSQLFGCTLRTNVADSGGAAFDCYLSNCVVIGNAAIANGGGLHFSVAVSSTLISNIAASGGGGAYNSGLTSVDVLYNRAAGIGGGAYGGTGLTCRILFNTAVNGGGSYEGLYSSCLFYGNQGTLGGGAYNSEFRNCTVAGNSASTSGGGLYDDSLAFAYNSILFSNTAPANPNYFASSGFLATRTCSWPTNSSIPAAFTNDPQFTDWAATNLRLLVTSPYLNAGDSFGANHPRDLDGNPRVTSCAVDLGAYEALVTYDTDCDGMPDWWEALHFGNPTNTPPGAPASNGVNNVLDAWIADLNPTSPASVFRIAAVSNAPGATLGILLQPTSTARSYRLHFATNLLDAPPSWVAAGAAQTGTGSSILFWVTNAAATRAYRSVVGLP